MFVKKKLLNFSTPTNKNMNKKKVKNFGKSKKAKEKSLSNKFWINLKFCRPPADKFLFMANFLLIVRDPRNWPAKSQAFYFFLLVDNFLRIVILIATAGSRSNISIK